jgi:sodium transport system permease protein
MSLRHAWIMLRKELRSTLRDRSALLGFLLVPLLAPLVYGLVFTLIAQRVSDESALVLPIAGAANAPPLVQWLGQQTGVTVVAAPADPERAVREGRSPGVLVIGSGFGQRLAHGWPAPLTLVSDGSRGESQRFAGRVHALLAAYGGDLTTTRLTLRGIDPAIVAPLKLEDTNVSAARAHDGGILTFVSMLMIWMALVSGMPRALESTAGERERASLEPLLLNPVSSTSVVAGKWLAATAMSSLGLLIATASTMLTLRIVPWHELGMQMRVTDGALLGVVLVMLPVALLMSAAVMVASALSRSFQQAQSYAGLLMVGALVPGMLSLVVPLTAPWTAALPVIGQMSITQELLSGQLPALLRQGLALAGTVVPAILLVVLTARLMRREAVVFVGE